MWDRMVTFARRRKGPSNEVFSRRALLATSALAGLSLCLFSGEAGAGQFREDRCSAALAGKSRAAIEQFLREYPADRLACLATATTSADGATARGGQGSNGAGGSGAGSAGSSGHGGGSGNGAAGNAANGGSSGQGNAGNGAGSGSGAGNG
jgi:hypothetical protein